jgi:DNA-binding NarL/FixJ family response regulator
MNAPPATIRTLIVHASRDLASIWRRFLERQGIEACVATDADAALSALRAERIDALVLDVELGADAITVADLADFHHPGLPVIAVTARSFFSDGAVFELIPNVRGLLPASPRLPDMAAMISHYGGRYRASAPAPAAMAI